MSIGPVKRASTAVRPTTVCAAPATWLDAPDWLLSLMQGAARRSMVRDDIDADICETDAVTLVSTRIAGAAAYTADQFEQATARAYTTIAELLASAAASHPVRFWNFIPGIHVPSGPTTATPESLDRYMVFNAGRYSACRQWLGGEDVFPRLLATASGVGHEGTDLIIHALATSAPGLAIENPRQVPAYRYSSRYGPKPPCFARATAVDLGNRRTILIGGTASVRGEQSMFIGDLRKQVGETLDNLAALLQAATADDTAGPHLMTEVRIYHVRDEDVPVLRVIATPAFPAARIEFVRADICRQDLLVEIEGVA